MILSMSEVSLRNLFSNTITWFNKSIESIGQHKKVIVISQDFFGKSSLSLRQVDPLMRL